VFDNLGRIRILVKPNTYKNINMKLRLKYILKKFLLYTFIFSFLSLSDIKTVYASNDVVNLDQQTVQGIVTNAETGDPVYGVNVIVKDSAETTGSTIGTQTDFEGAYSIDVPEGLNTLVFSYIGFRETEVEIDGRSEINV